ncbi:MAG: endonuclease domain-containing protein [Proteobacteria bacterium]|nr:endonuclease domain-containing protein [Pseudomonadota bacterium]
MSRERAKGLRGWMTDAERRLWYRLRVHRLNGVKFKRQVPIGPYIVDFASLERRLIVEVDGGQHAHSEADRRRDVFLREQGYRVIRFWNNDVLRQTDSALEGILAALEDASAPLPAARCARVHPLPDGERGKTGPGHGRENE